jgi:hypothetical protein
MRSILDEGGGTTRIAMGRRVDKVERGRSFIRWCEERDYLPIDEEYRTAKSPMRYLCTCGARRSISWKRMDRGETGCKPCASVRGASRRKYTIEQARERFLARNLTLITGQYEHANAIMAYVCLVCGVRDEMRLGSLNYGHGCRTCAYRFMAAARRTNIAEVRACFDATGLELLDAEYSNNATPMSYRCATCGHVGAMAFKVVRRGGGCAKCAILNRTGSAHPRWIEDREEARLRKKIIEKCHSALKYCLMCLAKEKTCTTTESLGYSPEHLRQHLERFPGWQDLIKVEWHLDHIFPIIAFIEYGIGDVRIINSLGNLQPLPAKANLSKSGSYDRVAFEEYLADEGIVFTRHGSLR